MLPTSLHQAGPQQTYPQQYQILSVEQLDQLHQNIKKVKEKIKIAPEIEKNNLTLKLSRLHNQELASALQMVKNELFITKSKLTKLEQKQEIKGPEASNKKITTLEGAKHQLDLLQLNFNEEKATETSDDMDYTLGNVPKPEEILLADYRQRLQRKNDSIVVLLNLLEEKEQQNQMLKQEIKKKDEEIRDLRRSLPEKYEPKLIHSQK